MNTTCKNFDCKKHPSNGGDCSHNIWENGGKCKNGMEYLSGQQWSYQRYLNKCKKTNYEPMSHSQYFEF